MLWCFSLVRKSRRLLTLTRKLCRWRKKSNTWSCGNHEHFYLSLIFFKWWISTFLSFELYHCCTVSDIIFCMQSDWNTPFPLLPRGSPFGDLAPHGDLFQILGPHLFFKVPIFSILSLRAREKSVQPPSNDDHLIIQCKWHKHCHSALNDDKLCLCEYLK